MVSLKNLLNNIDGHIYRNVEGYYGKFFSSEDVGILTSTAKANLVILSDFVTGDLKGNSRQNAIEALLNTINERPDLQWNTIANDLSDVEIVRLCGDCNSSKLKGSLFVRAIGVATPPTSKGYWQGFTQLCMTAGSTFKDDPLRLFIHGFITWGNLMELWTFDRAGLYSCEPFDLRHNPARLVHVISTYGLLQEDQLGANMHVGSTEHGKVVFGSTIRNIHPLYLQDDPISFNNVYDIVRELPVVYSAARDRSSKPDMVVKFRWRQEFLHSEGDVFATIDGQPPRGVVQLFHSEDIASTSSLRAGLKFGSAFTLVSEENIPDTSDLTNRLPNCFVPRHPDTVGDEGYMNRILSCIAVYPKGILLEKYQKPIHVIQAFRDALQGHRALYQQHGILHRDISPLNILLTDTSTDSSTASNSLRGFLIDIEGALSLKLPAKRNQIIGTRTFNSIRLLQLEMPQTYRGDLESFMYSLVWFCVHRQSSTIRNSKESRLWRWNGPPSEELAALKLADMYSENFALILDEFHLDFQEFRGLAEEIRALLFPVQLDGSLWAGTDVSEGGTNALYDSILDAFDKAISAADH